MQPLKEADPEVYALIAKEKERQVDCIELIASEVRYRGLLYGNQTNVR